MSEAAPADSPWEPVRQSTKRILLAVGVISFGILTLCVWPSLLGVLLNVASHLLFGWLALFRRSDLLARVAGTHGISAIIAGGLFAWGGALAVRRLAPMWSGGNIPHRRAALLGFAAVAAGVLLTGLLHEVQWWVRTPGRMARYSPGGKFAMHMDRSRDLRQIGKAMHQYHDAFDRFPTGGIFSERGDAGHGWMTALLPYIDQTALHHSIRHDLPWQHPANRASFETRVPTFESHLVWFQQGIPETGYAPAHYAANWLILRDNFSLRRNEIGDGTSNTALVGEIAAGFPPWGSPGNFRDLSQGIHPGPTSFGTVDREKFSTVMVLNADGSVRWLGPKTSLETVKALATPNGRDTVGPD